MRMSIWFNGNIESKRMVGKERRHLRRKKKKDRLKAYP